MGIVNRTKAQGRVVKGQTKVAVGEATDDEGLVAEGRADQVMGNLKRVGDKVGEKVEKVGEKVGHRVKGRLAHK